MQQDRERMFSTTVVLNTNTYYKPTTLKGDIYGQ